ncbi:hypothetical protein NDK43_08860 [Neobacillus pocheonensis]|uniref:Lipoprotein n=1 Tax=Neobacillus pocheonensis TaxID=363869 RepID=A0ABT0W8Z0_9BACI|nr:hypothetical protein [Neobacillus pocheonensis]
MKKYILGIIAIFLTFGLGACSSQTQKSNHKANQMTANAKKVKSRKVASADNQTLLHLLKMDPISLKDEVKSGKSIVDIGKEKNVTEDQMVNAWQDQNRTLF